MQLNKTVAIHSAMNSILVMPDGLSEIAKVHVIFFSATFGIDY